MAEPLAARILLAVGMDGVGIVLATDSAGVAYLVDAASNNTDDLGIAHPEDAGVYLWEGTLHAWKDPDTWNGPGEHSHEFAGGCTRLEFDRLDELLDMAPPEPTEEQANG